jgi:hypothetical protein
MEWVNLNGSSEEFVGKNDLRNYFGSSLLLPSRALSSGQAVNKITLQNL